MLISRTALIPKVSALVNLTKSLTAEDIQKAIRHSLCFKKRSPSPRKAVWSLARELARLAKGSYLSRSNAKKICRIWYLEAKKCGLDLESLTYKPHRQATFKRCWQDLWQAIPKVKYAAGTCLANLYKLARGDGQQRLESLVGILGRYHQGKPFALSSNALAVVFGVHQSTISRWLRNLTAKGILVVETQHSFQGASAREYSLKPLKKQSFDGNALHARVSDISREVKRSTDGITGTRKGIFKQKREAFTDKQIGDLWQIATGGSFEERKAALDELRRLHSIGRFDST